MKRIATTIIAMLLVCCLLVGCDSAAIAKRSAAQPSAISTKATPDATCTAEEEPPTAVPASPAPTREASTAEPAMEDNRIIITPLDLAESTRSKYVSTSAYDYADPIYEMKRDEPISITLGFDPLELGMEKIDEIAYLYQDSELEYAVNPKFNLNEQTGELTFYPSRAYLPVSTYELDFEEYGYPDIDKSYLHQKEDGEDWGNLGHMYLAQYVDLQTGEKLEKPIITVITLEGELPTPQVRFTPTTEGLAGFSWEAVPGAKKYLVVQTTKSSASGFSGSLLLVGQTEETFWRATSDDVLVNSDFNVARVTEDDWANDHMREYYEEEGYTEEDIPVLNNEEDRKYFGVIALSETGTSMVSNLFRDTELASQLPYSLSFEALGEDEAYTASADSISSAPSHRWVVMCDGTVQRKILNYRFDLAGKDTVQWGTYEKEDMSDLVWEDVEVVSLPYTIDGTPFPGKITVEKYTETTLQKDLEALERRQENLRGKTGALDVRLDVGKSKTGQSGEIAVNASYPVTANSALSEYLAVNLIGGTENIDLSMFKEASDPDKLNDAFLEAKYQNPLIPAIVKANASSGGLALSVTYEDNAATRLQKQQDTYEEAEKVIAKIILPGMTDIEKEIAINDYICDIADYDLDALNNAASKEYASVDPQYSDSFTAYGVLKKGLGVCSGYSGAFKLLADLAGLESIVTTGYLEGTLSHTWNKVKIGDEWHIVDVTNNDNEVIINALLNLPDNAAAKSLMEDDRYVINEKLGDYAATTSDFEYYRIRNKYFDVGKISTELAQDIEKEGSALLRTDYNLDDDTFDEIRTETAKLAGIDHCGGYYWMGVIYLEDDKAA